MFYKKDDFLNLVEKDSTPLTFLVTCKKFMNVYFLLSRKFIV